MTRAAHIDGQAHDLGGSRICLIFEHSLSHYARLLDEIQALQQEGAIVQLLTSNSSVADAPADIVQRVAPLWADPILANPTIRWRLLRALDWRVRHAYQAFRSRLPSGASDIRRRALREVVREVDLLWVIDEPSLPSAVAAVRGTDVRIVYETVDLVPEYRYRGERYRRSRLAEERRLIPRVHGFITACDSYADYYEERYGRAHRPVVRDNMSTQILDEIRPASRPLRLLFLGSLMFDRPVLELVRALALVTADVTLTFQGKNYLGEEPAGLCGDLGQEHRVRILAPCAADEIVDRAGEFDIGIVALRGLDENERRASTSKLFTYMAAGLAVLGSDLPGIRRVIATYGNGLMVPDASPEAWARAIDDLAALSLHEIDAMKRRSLDAAAQHAWTRQRTAFIEVFKQALSGSEAMSPSE